MTVLQDGVFISYRRTRSFVARAVAQDLERNGFDVFMDVDGLDNGPYDQSLLNEIGRRKHFVVILGPDSLERCASPADWLRREIETAIELERNIVPLFEGGFRFDVHAPRLPAPLARLPRYNGLALSHEHFRPTMDRLRAGFLQARTGSTGGSSSEHLSVSWKRLEACARDRFTELWRRCHPGGPSIDVVLDTLWRSFVLVRADPYPLVEGLLLAFESDVGRRIDLTSTFNGMWSSLEGYLTWLHDSVDQEPRALTRPAGLGGILQGLGLTAAAERVRGLDGETLLRAVKDVRAYRNHYLHGGARPDAVHVAEGCRSAMLTLWLAVSAHRASLEMLLARESTLPPAVAVVASRSPARTGAGAPDRTIQPSRTKPKPPSKSPPVPCAPAAELLEELTAPDFGRRSAAEKGRVFSGLVVQVGYARAVPELMAFGNEPREIVEGLQLAGHEDAAKRVRKITGKPISKKAKPAPPPAASSTSPATKDSVSVSPRPPSDPLTGAAARRAEIEGLSTPERGRAFEKVILRDGHDHAARSAIAAGWTAREVVEALVAHGHTSMARNAAKAFARLGDGSARGCSIPARSAKKKKTQRAAAKGKSKKKPPRQQSHPDAVSGKPTSKPHGGAGPRTADARGKAPVDGQGSQSRPPGLWRRLFGLGPR